jgi:hypothetical protein
VKKKPYERKEKWLKASDNWCPNFPGDLVQTSLVRDGGGSWRVCVWGGDDLGMEKSFETRLQALECYQALPKVISQKILKDLGFVRA